MGGPRISDRRVSILRAPLRLAISVPGPPGEDLWPGLLRRRLRGGIRGLPCKDRGTDSGIPRAAGGRGEYVRPPAAVVDVGCAIGLFLRVAEEHGWTSIGVEHSAWAADYGRQTWGLAILPDMRAATAARPMGFDAITMWDVIEHLPDPHRVLEEAHSILRDGGYLALSTLNSSSLGARLAGRSWRHVVPPLHLNYFTRASLFRLLRLTGFEPVFHRAEGVCLRAAAPAVLVKRWVAPWTRYCGTGACDPL